MFSYKDTMDKLIKNEVDSGNVVGANALVIHKGNEIYHNTFGYADKENKIPMKRDTIFRMYSMTKPITAVATMILVERGEIDLWDPISKYIPEFLNQEVYTSDGKLTPVKREVNIQDLLNMTSGIPYPDESNESGRQMEKLFTKFIERREKGDSPDTMEYIKAIGKVPLVFQPGEKWMYGLSADILGGIIEIVSGKKYGQFLKEELFDPLDMKDTGFFVPKDKLNRFAKNYSWNEEKEELSVFNISHLGEYYGEDVAFESGGAGLVSTIDDYSHFAMMMVNKGEYNGKRILGRKTIEFMAQDRLASDQKDNYKGDGVRGYGYGFLMRILIDQKEAAINASLGEFGWDGWTGNYVIMDPKENVVFMYFIQRCGSGVTPIVRKLRMATYAALE